ncbi:MAG: DUF3696 domain-containing protein [Candidatus Omnitrophota bacterium]
MLNRIQLRNFKCFKDRTDFPLNRVNLLTGINGRGKSTLLQSILLMCQSFEYCKDSSKLIFNGNLVQLGNFEDVKNRSSSINEKIEFIFSLDASDWHYFFEENEEDDMTAEIINSPTINSAFKRVHYVSANRIGPQDFYPRQSTFEFPTVGTRGEYTANVLAVSKKKQQKVPDRLVLDSGATKTVLDQTEAWIEKIFDGGSINVEPVDANIVILQMNSQDRKDSTEMFKPLNIGFGYSYALPIIVSGLIAQEGDILIVENPEAHLHPCAQSQIAKFLARVSCNGVQVFVESHSDHILNGLRVAVFDKIITAEDLNILYFQREHNQQVIKIPVMENGEIRDWPPGFFDQMDKDFEKLFGV